MSCYKYFKTYDNYPHEEVKLEKNPFANSYIFLIYATSYVYVELTKFIKL